MVPDTWPMPGQGAAAHEPWRGGAMMPNMERWMILAAAGAQLAAAGLGLYAAVRRYRGRATPRVLTRLAAGLLGAGLGVFMFFFVRQPVLLAWFLVFPALVAFAFVHGGQRIAGGILLVSLGLPSLLWWGYFLVADTLDPTVEYLPTLWLWWAPGPILVIAGTALLLAGDPPARARRTFETMPGHVRNPAAIVDGIQQATGLGGAPVQLVVAMTAAMTVAAVGIPLALGAGWPWPVVLAAGSVVFALIGTELSYLAMPQRVRRAWEGWSLVGNPELKRWRDTVKTPVPAGTAAIRRWLAAHPETPENRWARSELLVLAGEMAEARAVVERLPAATDWERFERRDQEAYIDWVEGNDPDLDALQAEADAIAAQDAAQGRLADAAVASARARDLAVRGEDWMGPLIDVRDRHGSAAEGLLREDLRRRLYPMLLLVGLAFCGFIALLSGI